MTTTLEQVLAHRQSGSWRTLADVAQLLVADAELHAGSVMNPKLGGGTRLMLALNHRISHDIDLFIRDPQWIGYLSPRLNDRFEHVFTAYNEGATSLKLKLPDGEIDFIVAMSLLDLPDEQSSDTPFVLEPVAEVLAKKLFYRGWSLTPRDLFDWWKIETTASTAMPSAAIPHTALAKLLQGKTAEIQLALAGLSRSPLANQTWNAIQAPALPDLTTTAQWGMAQLVQYESLLVP